MIDIRYKERLEEWEKDVIKTELESEQKDVNEDRVNFKHIVQWTRIDCGYTVKLRRRTKWSLLESSAACWCWCSSVFLPDLSKTFYQLGLKIKLKCPFPESFSLFSSFSYLTVNMHIVKILTMTGLNLGPLVSVATSLPQLTAHHIELFGTKKKSLSSCLFTFVGLVAKTGLIIVCST